MKQVVKVIGKLKGRSLDELRVRGAQQLSVWAERRNWSKTARLPGDGELFQLLDAASFKENVNAASLLDHFQTRPAPGFFAAFSEPSETISALTERFGGPHKQALLERARRIVEGKFDLLGYRDLFFGEPIDWQLEPVSGKTAPSVHWSQINYLNPEAVGDKKITWELNRHQYFATLGRAYWHTHDEQYAQTFVAHLSAWMDCNPPKVGINWASSLEVSFRCISWLWAMHFFRQSPHLEPQFLLRVWKFIYVHARHLESYLSTYFSPNTHLTGEALGLFYLGVLLPEFKRAAHWRHLGQSVLRAELERHVKPDGVYFEQASYYHRYTADFYLHFYLLARANEIPLDSVVSNKLIALLDHLLHLTKPDGTTPLFGDDDGGRLVMLEDRAPNDFRATLAAGAALFARPDYKYVAGEVSEEVLWLLGGEGLRAFDDLDAQIPAGDSRAFTDGGYYVMRDGWSRTANYLLIDCGPHGVFNCGHAHADALAFELAARGRTLLVDPGTYTYTAAPQMRNYFRSSAAHNTLTVDGVSSSVPDGPFTWQSIAQTSVQAWRSKEQFDYLEAAHDGYRALAAPAVHTRSVLFIKGAYWIVRDQVETAGEHRYDLNFHFAADAAPTIEKAADGTSIISERAPAAAGLDLCTFGGSGAWRQEDGQVSRWYGDLSTAPVCTFSAQSTGAAEFITFLMPCASSAAPARVREIETSAKRAFEVSGEDKTDLLMIGQGAAGRVDSNFSWNWTRASANSEGALQKVVLLGGNCFRWHGRTMFEASARVEYFAARRVAREWHVETEATESLLIAAPPGVEAVVLNGESFPVAGRDILKFVANRLQEEHDAAEYLIEVKR